MTQQAAVASRATTSTPRRMAWDRGRRGKETALLWTTDRLRRTLRPSLWGGAVARSTRSGVPP